MHLLFSYFSWIFFFHFQMQLILLIYLIVKTNGDWVKLEHFTPTQLNIIKTDPVTTVISGSSYEVPVTNVSTVKIINNETVTTSSIIDIAESKIVNSNLEPFLISSDIKDSLLGSYWALNEQNHNTLRGKLIFLQNIKQNLLHGICK